MASTITAADLKVKISFLGITIIFLTGNFFNSFNTFGKESDSDFAGITKVMSFITKFRSKFLTFLLKSNRKVLLQNKKTINYYNFQKNDTICMHP